MSGARWTRTVDVASVLRRDAMEALRDALRAIRHAYRLQRRDERVSLASAALAVRDCERAAESAAERVERFANPRDREHVTVDRHRLRARSARVEAARVLAQDLRDMADRASASLGHAEYLATRSALEERGVAPIAFGASWTDATRPRPNAERQRAIGGLASAGEGLAFLRSARVRSALATLARIDGATDCALALREDLFAREIQG